MSGDLSILIYHRVLAHADPLLPGAPSQTAFARQMMLVRRWFRVLPLPLALDLLDQGRLPARALAITFDDGYADNAELALPVLRSLDLAATFFIASAYLDGHRMWNDDIIEHVRQAPHGVLDGGIAGLGALPVRTAAQRRQAIDSLLAALKYRPPAERQALATQLAPPTARPLMMTSDQVRLLHREGMTIGGHTHTHPILARIEDSAARREIVHNKSLLEQLTCAPVELFAYPNGKPGADFDGRHAALVRALGFRAAFTTAPGVTRSDADRFQLPRYTPWQIQRPRFLAGLLRNRYRRQSTR
jgi:peptidoglycan/xylan/chitin deacetylase (PgdA/CDA1 family)